MKAHLPDCTFVASMIAVTSLVLGILVGLSVDPVTAQDDAGTSHPAHLHDGTCEAPGEVVAPLSNIGSDFVLYGQPAEDIQPVGLESGIDVISSATTIEMPLSTFLESEHVLMVHESEQNIQNYVACGDVGGSLIHGSDLQFEIQPLNDSGLSGIAWLFDNGDGTTTAYVFLMGEGASSPAERGFGAGANDAADEDTESGDLAASGASVDIVGFAFNPETIEIGVGDTVTWTNSDGVPHTATQEPAGSGFQSGSIQGGDTLEFTFNEPGEFAYFCEFHPNMTGTIIVTE